ncbi:hypothetical protein CsSME_00040245 [Camellia sinensis var. sinensis]
MLVLKDYFGSLKAPSLMVLLTHPAPLIFMPTQIPIGLEMHSNLISWSSKKKATVSRSSNEAEYRSLAHKAAELAWIGMLLQDFCIVPPTAPLLYCDNVYAIALASNPVFHSKSKHIEVDCHFVRDQVLAKRLVLHYIPTIDQLANIFTKSLFVSRFFYLKDKLMLVSPSFSLRGNVEDPILDSSAISASFGCRSNFNSSSKNQLYL